jgi:hypothetical protein
MQVAGRNLLIAVLLAAAACSSSLTARHMAEATVDLEIPEHREHRFTLLIMRNERTLDQSAHCDPPMPGLTATFNGVRMKRFLGLVINGEFGYSRDCIVELGFSRSESFARPGSGASADGPSAYGSERAEPIPAEARSNDAAIVRF